MRAGRGRRGRRADREARAAEPRRDPRRSRAVRPPGRRVQRLRRVREREGGRGTRLARRAAGRDRVIDGDQARGRRLRRLVLGQGARRLALSEKSELARQAARLIPGGVNSPVRAMKAVGLGVPATAGVPTGATADTVVCPYNDVVAAATAVERYGEGLACVIVEPVAGNMGVIPPEPGFLQALRQLCDASGALLVFDEVITGFRIARGGAQERLGVRADLTVLGKIVGGGMPIGAFGGSAEVMSRLAPVGDVYQAGTLSGNPLATAAGISVLRRLRDPAVYEELERRAARLESGLRELALVQRVGAMATLFVGSDPDQSGVTSVTNFSQASACDTERYGAYFRHMLERGIYVPPSQFEAMFVSLAHSEEEIDRTVEAAAEFFGG